MAVEPLNPHRTPHSTETRERALALVEQGATMLAAAEAVGASRTTVQAWVLEARRAAHGVNRRGSAVDLVRGGASPTSAARAVGTSVALVREWLEEEGVEVKVRVYRPDRSVSLNRKRMRQEHRRQEAPDPAILDDVERPRTRGDCASVPRPCPFVSCRHNLYLDVNGRNGTLKLNFPAKEPDEMTESCSLDVADRGGATLDAVGAMMNLTRERVRQVEVMGGRRMRQLDERGGLAELSVAVDEMAPAVEPDYEGISTVEGLGQVRDVEPRPFEPPEWARRITEERLKGRPAPPCTTPQKEPEMDSAAVPAEDPRRAKALEMARLGAGAPLITTVTGAALDEVRAWLDEDRAARSKRRRVKVEFPPLSSPPPDLAPVVVPVPLEDRVERILAANVAWGGGLTPEGRTALLALVEETRRLRARDPRRGEP